MANTYKFTGVTIATTDTTNLLLSLQKGVIHQQSLFR